MSNIEELKGAAARAVEARDGIKRDMESASPERRSALEGELNAAMSRADDAGRYAREAEQKTVEKAIAEREAAGFGGKNADAVAGSPEAEKARAQEQRQEARSVTEQGAVVKQYVQEGRGMRRSARPKVRTMELHIHPDTIKDRQTMARSAAMKAIHDREQAAQRKEKTAREAAERKDMDAAARLYEGLPQNRGITREQYQKREQDWQEHLNAHPEKREANASRERSAYIAERNAKAERAPALPKYREAQPGEEITGKLAGVVKFEGVKHIVIETPNKERVVMAGDLPGKPLGREVVARADQGGRLVPAPEREQERDRQAVRER